MLLVIDNYDSFTWNLVQRLGEVAIMRGQRLEPGDGLHVARNDEITVGQAEALQPTGVVISPGPCTPNEAGVSAAIIERFAGVVPVLGVCLGFQVMAQMHGIEIVRHAKPMHGRTSAIAHDGEGLFAGVPSPIDVARYHSLAIGVDHVDPPVPDQDSWAVSAWLEGASNRRTIMGLRRVWADPHKAPLEGVQFHPESYLTPEGAAMLRNFLEMVERHHTPAARATEATLP
ncbi:MAG: aminodeoxychorismate/anthranilate synthase component II [Phycisphaerales bacterium]|nr:aminodeoxychorismate/anthranilate synthase component II [Phycisphaerales bacterium]